MPGLDRTGPGGQGSRTGRQMGRCVPKNQTDKNPEEDNRGRITGRGMGRGRGQGMNRRN